MASTLYSSYYDSTTHRPVGGMPNVQAYGNTTYTVRITLPTTQLDTLADTAFLFPMKKDAHITSLLLTWDSLAASALDADIVLRDDGGDTILFNAGTAFCTAEANGKPVLVKQLVTAVNDDASLIFYVNVAGTTPAQGVLTMQVTYKGYGNP